MEWVAVEAKPRTGRRSKPAVSISTIGMIGFNSAAMKTQIGEILDQTKTSAAILYSPNQKMMAVLPIAEGKSEEIAKQMVALGVAKTKPQFYKVRILKNRRTIPAKSAFVECGIPLPKKAIFTEPSIADFPELGPIITFSVDSLFRQENFTHEAAATAE